MKKRNLTLATLLFFIIAISAQNIMQIYQKGGKVSQLLVAEVDSIVFIDTTTYDDSTSIDNPITYIDSVVDIDGNFYHAVAIGTQVWMAENLRTTKYRDGSPIPNVTDSSVWILTTEGAYCNYNNDTTHSNTYGRLYNWYAVIDTRNIAPEGWHVPTQDEWNTLVQFLGGGAVAGGKLKETGTAHWNSPNRGATNAYGFSGLGAGTRLTIFSGIGQEGTYWNASIWAETKDPWVTSLFYNSMGAGAISYDEHNGLSVRCIKD
jgi:uncharacterized protein (TIGR02145 family)